MTANDAFCDADIASMSETEDRDTNPQAYDLVVA